MPLPSDANIVAAFSVTHTPGLGNQLDAPAPEQVERLMQGFGIVREQIAEAKPDVIVAFVNDHWDMFTQKNMPGFAIGTGDSHWGPTPMTEQWLQIPRGPIPGNRNLAQALLKGLTEDGFELYRFDSAEFVHNVLMPRKFLWPDTMIPVVPIYINCFSEPLPTWRRAFELGQAVRRVLNDRPERIALLASGGISHWPPITDFEVADDDPFQARIRNYMEKGRDAVIDDPTLPLAILERERQMAEGRSDLINVEWDKEILARLADADADYLTAITNEEAKKDGGAGAPEMMMWLALAGAMYPAKGDVVMYEAVHEWMGGVGLISYDRAIRSR